MDQEREEQPADQRPAVSGRWQVLGTGFAIGVFLAVYFVAEKVDGPIADRLLALAIILAGPLNPCLWETVPALATVSLLVSPAVFAHPIRPRLLTALATIIAMAIWFFAGFGALAVHIGP